MSEEFDRQEVFDEGYERGHEDGFDAGVDVGKEFVISDPEDYLDNSTIDDLSGYYAASYGREWASDCVGDNLHHLDTDDLKYLATRVIDELEGR